MQKQESGIRIYNLKMMQGSNRGGTDQSNADGKHRKSRPRRRNVFTAIFSGACGSRRTLKSSFYASDEDKDRIQGKEKTVSEAHELALNTLSFSGGFRRTYTGFSLRRWKTVGTKGFVLKPGFGVIVRRQEAGRGEKMEERENGAEEEEREIELELCKKRILMGEKCRPLNPSGVLHYDKEGIFLPEDVLT